MNEKEFLDDLTKLIAQRSIRDLSTRTANAPFGKGIRNAMDTYLEIAERLGFKTGDVDGYAVYAQLGDNERELGILGHLDVVEVTDLKAWRHDPFQLSREGDLLIARGVNDDKGPLLCALYAAKEAYDRAQEPKRSVRIIAGGAEETTWECMEYYFQHHAQPELGFSPDGNFPIVNGEKGIICFSLKFKNEVHDKISSTPIVNYICHDLKFNNKSYTGDKILSRNPQRGDNSIDKLLDDLDGQAIAKRAWAKLIRDFFYHNPYLNNTKFHSEHFAMGKLSACLMSLNSDEDQVILNVDFRYPISTNKQEIIGNLEVMKSLYDFEYEVIREKQPLYVAEESELIQKLKTAYETVMKQKADVLTKGGASYARVMDCGVAFGASFPWDDPKPHMPNEQMSIDSLRKAYAIYVEAIRLLLEI
ncbi:MULTISPECIES: Sapep family Mn(2+)-dependent dipeptidase [Terrabacteria group]|uniref:Sapep family Mn(2+)-dependent dipeptidase n=1 Tax=Bacillati TaxID=1783272 RepID=UPI001C6DE0FF|nr:MULTISPECIES: Sapep family Mn(2+)-dependent dipeptidase [Terrabacteria group]MBW9212192.1 Sapep family Mn(2+)-dependent dipeptidase [Trueperella sp. zg.1013]